MSKISVDVSSARIPVLQVGYQGENEVTDVLFDISSWITEFGEGVAQLRVKRPGNSEEESYVLSLTITDGIAVWTVSETDTFNKGNGKVQLSYMVGNIVKKAVIYPYKVGKSIVGADNPVDPFDSWIERSKAWAIGETLDGGDVPETDETYQNNAKYYAEQADILGSAQVVLATEKADAAAASEAAVNGVSTQLTTRMSAIETEQAVQDARMDTFASLPVGSTSGNAELADIRVGADGTTYDTAGNAVRGQISELKSDIDKKIDNPTSEDNNKFPRATNGNVEWVEQGLPTDEQTATAVQNWLNEHPEATTTVQDRSLTINKMVLGTLGYVTPEMFGAVGDGVTDDTEAIQRALNYGLSNVIFKGTYKVSINPETNHALDIPSNINLFLWKSIIILADNTSTSYHIFDIKQKRNISIIGGCIKGDKASYSGESTEWCHGIGCDGGNNIVIKDTIIEYCRGDGIAFENDLLNTNCLIDNVICNENGRNGLSVVNGENIKIINSKFTNTNRTAPMYGIDLEATPNSNCHLKNIEVSNCVFNGNTYGAINVLSLEDNDNIIINDCFFYGTMGLSVKSNNTSVLVNNCYIKPDSKVDPSTVEWSYGVGNALVVGCCHTSNITINNITVDCSNNINSIVLMSELAELKHHNITITNLVALNGSTERVTLNRTSEPSTNVFIDITIRDNLTVNINNEGLSINDPIIFNVNGNQHIKNNILAPMANRIFIEGGSTNINYWYPYEGNELLIYNDDNIEHALIGPTFINNSGVSTTRLVIESNKCIKISYIRKINACLYSSIN